MSGFITAMQRRSHGTLLDTIGLRVLEANDTHIVAAIDFRPELAQFTGLFHTGTLLALADSAATMACMYAFDPTGEADGNAFPLAVQLSANLIRNASAGTATAEARLLHRGRTTMVVQTTVCDERDRPMVVVTTTHLVLAGTGTTAG